MTHSSRCLDYDGVDPAWEARELRLFTTHGSIRSAQAVTNYLLGRLLAEDLHVSCKPMLPPNIHDLNGMMIQGTCLLQIVDIVNIGANFEHRTEDSKGPTRTLKLCLTDGYQTVFGFEYKWMPALSVKTPRGTKVIIQNVAVRHGMMMLTPETCHILGVSGNDALDASKLPSSGVVSTDETPSGAYAAALVNSGVSFTTRKSTTDESSTPSVTTKTPPPMQPTPMPPRTNQLPQTAAELIGARSTTSTTTPRSNNPSPHPLNSTASHPNMASPPRRKTPQVVNPAVFVDISSGDEDMASDVTDPMVEHLFYSPNTPRLKDNSRTHATASRKRPHPESSRSRTPPPPSITPAPEDIVDVADSPPAPPQRQPSFSLLSDVFARTSASKINLKSPFVYFDSRTSELTEKGLRVGSILTIRGFMKSVSGFQFNTGVYNLRVLIEDGTATKDVQVDPALVESLMGVSCTEFATAMQSTPSVAHRLAAKMQVTLMTMQGIMRLRLDAMPDKWSLLECCEYTSNETHALLARVRHYAQKR